MANTILTPTMITREALRVLHQKCNFIGNVNRQYDDKFAKTGAKIGTALNIRMPSKYSVRTGAAISYQEHVERSTALNVSSQYGVDVSFTSVELTMNLDDFSERIIDPAMAQLAAKIEGDCMATAYKLVNNYTNAHATNDLTYKLFQQGGANITKQLAPLSQRAAILTPDSMVEFADVTKGLFHDSSSIKKLYREGMMGRTAGFDVYESTLTPGHTTGSFAGTPLTTGAALGTSTTANAWVSQTTMSSDGITSAKTIKAGDIVTFGTVAAGLVDVHPETKASTGKLKTFVVQGDLEAPSGETMELVVKPAVIWGSGNAYQNCTLTNSDTNNMTVSLIGAVSSAFAQDLQFHKDAFVFATADLEDVSQYGAWGARESMDGISMRLARQYAIGTDTVPTRIDILFGFAGLYPELANRHMYETDN